MRVPSSFHFIPQSTELRPVSANNRSYEQSYEYANNRNINVNE